MNEISWPTIVLSILVGLGSGTLAAVIGGINQERLARSATRRSAEKALWGFQRAISDYAAESIAGYHEAIPFTRTSPQDIAILRADAYPYRRYLGEHADLVSRMWMPEGEPEMDVELWSEDIQDWSNKLEFQLNEVFGRDSR